jgi:ribonuclease E
MLIDATHTEETRVVVLRGNRLEEFDLESSTKLQIKGNIYLAKVTRVEPSLQAAFVEYGGNRHGFLAFNEIHPDYYQIPVEDRMALLEEEAAQVAKDLEDEESEISANADAEDSDGDDDADGSTSDEDADNSEEHSAETIDADDNLATSDAEQDDPAAEGEDEQSSEAVIEAVEGDSEIDDDDDDDNGEDADAEVQDEARRRRSRPRRNYKIQEVIKKRQVLLVQVVKEERGNKGAALTTYLSLAGRYCVLMPNTARGGGISRKITNQTARRKLKKTLTDLAVPEGMGVIVRTAGQSRTKSEIRRDFEYLFRVWDKVRDLTLESSAPALVYEEANLIKRAIRDLYTKDVDEVLVDGEEGYRTAKDFMRMLMPSHAKKVQPHKDRAPLFNKYHVHQQLDSMHLSTVTLKSGGYLVINPTEALISVDVNSGRSTKGYNVEDTAIKTNLEAAEELARQLRLRDLAGLIVIDFIDMDENRNNRAVERRMQEALKADRARVQVGRISSFGLLEMSRQRLRPSLQETSSILCPHREGSGLLRSVDSVTLQIIRSIEEECVKSRASEITVTAPSEIALFILNQKRAVVTDIEERYGVTVLVLGDDKMILPNFEIGGSGQRDAPLPVIEVIAPEPEDEEEEIPEGGKRKRRRRRRKKRDDQPDQIQDNGDVKADGEEKPDDSRASEDGEADTPKPRRRRRRKKSDKPEADSTENNEQSSTGNGDEEAVAATGEEEEGKTKRRRRGRRGGRKRRGEASEAGDEQQATGDDGGEQAVAVVGDEPEVPEESAGDVEQTITEPASEPEPAAVIEPVVEAEPIAAPELVAVVTTEPEASVDVVVELEPAAEPDPSKPKKRGWWQRGSA